MERRSEPEPPKLLLVEGQDDKHVVKHLRGRLAPDLVFHYKVAGGSNLLLKAIPAAMKPLERLALGIVMDANDGLAARWQAIGHQLRRMNVQLPEKPAQSGTIIAGTPRVGVWLMPNNSTSGELENFVAELLPKNDPIWPLAEQYIESIPDEHRQFTERKILRAKIHAWLATRERPKWMGTAIRAKDLDAEVPLAGELADWLRKLFGP